MKSLIKPLFGLVFSVICARGVHGPHRACAQEQRILDVHVVPTKRLQLAVWIEKDDGTYLRTIALTESVGRYGLGNRPGASQMNSGFHWPYGRREQVLPIWAYARAHAPGAQLFKRVIFQNRSSEGYASRTSNDFSPDNHYCVSFTQSNNSIDVMSCASMSKTDKGRYITSQDVANGYAEPAQNGASASGYERKLDVYSLYPPRRDIDQVFQSNGFYDTSDVADYRGHAKAVMPEIDFVSTATPPAQTEQVFSFTVPADWEDGKYKVWVEAHQEADFNGCFTTQANPTPTQPQAQWDSWAMQLGFPFRGQPSVAYQATVNVGTIEEVKVKNPAGMSSWDMLTMNAAPMQAMSNCMSNDAGGAPGSGADRLLLTDNSWRVKVQSRVVDCSKMPDPEPVENIKVEPYPDRKQAHQWVRLSFTAPNTQDEASYAYVIKVSRSPITDDETFTNAQPAYAASSENEAAKVPTTSPGSEAVVDLGGLVAQTRYYIAVRARNACNKPGPISSGDIQTMGVQYTTVSPCFVATAAYGSKDHPDVRWLRYVRDHHMRFNWAGRAFIDWYTQNGPAAAQFVLDHPWLQPAARAMLKPFILLTHWLLD